MGQSFSEVRVRFAPSPTGYLHVGGARTALYNYLFAKKNNGKFILRIEDTDEARSSEESLKMMVSDLQWLGLMWDEGPHPVTLKDVGPMGPYRQSERQSIYKQVVEELLKSGRSYYCFLTDEEIEAQRKKAKEEGSYAHVQSPYVNESLDEALEKIKKGNKAVVRFKTQHLKKDYVLKDLIRGEVKFSSDMVGDFVLLRSDGMPVYNFCCAVDDHLMKISHVLRAEEHLPNTLRQLMIYEAMNWALPEFGHVSLILDEDRQKLSKRRGAVACGQFKEEGYLPQALLNFLVLLGWSHPEGKEIISMSDMIQSFGLDRMNLSGAIFDRVKLKWLNAQHLRATPNSELWKLLMPYFEKENMELPDDSDWQNRSLDVFKTSMEILSDCVDLYKPLDNRSFKIKPESQEVLQWDNTLSVLESWINLLKSQSKAYLSESEFLQIQDQVKEKTGAKGKFLFMPIRVAVIGVPHGAELKILVPLLAVTSLIERAQKCVEYLMNSKVM